MRHRAAAAAASESSGSGATWRTAADMARAEFVTAVHVVAGRWVRGRHGPTVSPIDLGPSTPGAHTPRAHGHRARDGLSDGRVASLQP